MLEEIKPTGIGTKKMQKFEMSRYIDLNIYHEVERSHPFYKEMVEKMCSILREFPRQDRPVRVLELGAGTGLFTEDLVRLPSVEVSALELDANCYQYLKRLEKSNPGTTVMQGDAVTFCKPGHYDVLVSSFAHDHIHYDQAKAFAKNIRANLRKGGIYIMGGEILPIYTNSDERIESLYTYHIYIVNKALRDGSYKLAQIEINALESGIKMIGDFKRHEALFEEEMLSAAFKLVAKTKMGPLDIEGIGGVYTYVFEAI